MAKSNYISMPVIRRLPRYYRHLTTLKNRGINRVSSKELSENMGLTASQIRQDLNCFGGFWSARLRLHGRSAPYRNRQYYGDSKFIQGNYSWCR